MAKDTGFVNIHGKEYQTVASRVQQFREAYQQNLSLETEIHSIDAEIVVMKAYIKDVATGAVIATGHAEERRNASQINRTSALENCETSAIGRCLSAFGLGGTEFASADEVANAIHQQAETASPPKKLTPKPQTGYDSAISEAQGKLLLARARDFSGLTDWEDIRAWAEEQIGSSIHEIRKSEMEAALASLEEARV